METRLALGIEEEARLFAVSLAVRGLAESHRNVSCASPVRFRLGAKVTVIPVSGGHASCFAGPRYLAGPLGRFANAGSFPNRASHAFSSLGPGPIFGPNSAPGHR